MAPIGWDVSADAWIRHLGEAGDRGRRYVLDPVFEARLAALNVGRALDVGCGEGRFCRILWDRGIDATGIDPTEALIARARQMDAVGDYQIANAEALPFEGETFDLVITYLSLIDIPDFELAISEMARVLAPGGVIMAANLTSYYSAGDGRGWKRGAMGGYKHFSLDNYLETRAVAVTFAGVHVENWHRPLSAYMRAYLQAGLLLTYFDEPPAEGGPDGFAERYNRAPWFNYMEWVKPA